MALELTGSSLTIEDTVKVARDHADISISTTAFTACEKAHVLVKKLIEEDNVIYGVSVGVGELDCVDISREDQKNHQENLILAHACGVGPYMKADQSRAMMLIRLNNFLRAKSGVSPQLLKSMVAFLNKDLAASAPMLGSIGSSDLVPLSHMAAALIGEGEIIDGDRHDPADSVLRSHDLVPYKLQGRDGLALINGLAQSLGVATLALYDMRNLVNVAIATAHLNGELISPGYMSNQYEFITYKNHSTLDTLCKTLYELSPANDDHLVRSPLSCRYALTVFASLLDALKGAEEAILDELNAVSDNPIINEDGTYTNNSMNTSGARISFALDALSQVAATACLASERRTGQLTVREPINDLPAYMTHKSQDPGSNYGLMIAHYTAASLALEIRARSHSRSIQSVPAGGKFEDFNANAGNCAIHLAWLIEMFEYLTAIELLTTLQGYDVIDKKIPAPFKDLYDSVREEIPTLVENRLLSRDINALAQMIQKRQVKAPVHF